MKITRETKIGVVVVTAIILLIIGVNYLKGINMLSQNREYVAFYKNIGGLSPSDPVNYNGMQVGLVKSVKFIEGEKPSLDRMQVSFIIDSKNFRLTKNSEAMITTDFLGSSSIDLKLKDTVKARVGDTLIGTIDKTIEEEIGEKVGPLKKKAEDLIGSIDSVVTTITAFWDENTMGMLNESVVSVRNSLAAFEKAAMRIDTLIRYERGRIHTILADVQDFTGVMSANSENIDTTLSNLTTFSHSVRDVKIQPTVEQAYAAMEQLKVMMDQINSGEGTLGSIIHEDSVKDMILATNASLKLLFDDFQKFPNRYLHFSIFGSRDKVPKLNSEEVRLLKKYLDIDDPTRLKRFSKEESEKIDSLLRKL